MGSNSILTKDNMTEVVPKWQHPILPGRAVQGSLLFTTTDFVNPPQSAADFTWIAMEEICGIHDTKCYYDEKDNVYHFYKSIGHLNNDETWAEDWYEFASVQGISKEAQEMLETMEYIVYRFNQEPTEFGTHFTVVGVRKDMSEDTICDMYLPDKDYIDRQDIKYQPIDGNATSVVQDGDAGRKVNVRIDNDTITINDNNELVAESAVADEYTIHKEDGTHIISVIPNRDKGIDTSVNGVEAKVDSDSIDFNTNGQLHAIGDIRDGIATHIGDHIDSDNVHYKDVDVLYDTSKALQVNGDNQLEVKRDYNKGLEFNTNGELAVKVDETKGITFNADDGKVAAKITGTEGLEFDTDGNIKARVDGATVRIDDYGRLEAVPVEVREGKAIDIRKVEDEGDPYYVVDAIGDGTTIGYNDRTDLKVIPNTAKGITTSTKGVEARTDRWRGTDIHSDGNIAVALADTSGLDFSMMPNKAVSGLRVQCGKACTLNSTTDAIDVDVAPKGGITYDTADYDKLKLNANFTNSTTPLGNNPSNITMHSDGKISVDASMKTDELTTTTNTDGEIKVKLTNVDVQRWDTNSSGLKVVGNKSDPNGGLQINTKAESPIYLTGQTSVSSSVVDVRTSKGIVKDTSTGYGYLQAKLGQGLRFGTDDEVDTDAIKLNANFTTSDEPLGDNKSNIVLHSDGKIEVNSSGNPDNKTIELNADNKLQVMIRGNGSSSSISSGTGGLDWEYNSGIDNGLYVKAGKGITLNTTTDQLEPALRFDRENNRDWSGIAYQNGSMSVKGGLYVNTGDGLTIDANNKVKVNVDNESVHINSNNQLVAGVAPCMKLYKTYVFNFAGKSTTEGRGTSYMVYRMNSLTPTITTHFTIEDESKYNFFVSAEVNIHNKANNVGVHSCVRMGGSITGGEVFIPANSALWMNICGVKGNVTNYDNTCKNIVLESYRADSSAQWSTTQTWTFDVSTNILTCYVFANYVG